MMPVSEVKLIKVNKIKFVLGIKLFEVGIF